MATLPDHISRLNNKFKPWLESKGSSILAPTSDWEVLRFSTRKGVGIVYRNLMGDLTFNGPSKAAYIAFKGGKPWDGRPLRGNGKARQHYQTLVERDGEECFFCGAKDNLTIEHFVAATAGGSNHASNLCLACEPCNTAVGHKPVVEKIRYRDEKRGMS